MIVAGCSFMRAVGRFAKPFEVLAEPFSQCGLIRRSPALRGGNQLRRLNAFDEPACVDDSASALSRIPAYELRKSKMRCHARFRIEKPGAKLFRGSCRVFLVPREVPREGQRMNIGSELGDSGLVETALTFGIRHSVAPDVGQAVGLRRIRPPVRTQAEVIVLVSTRRECRFLGGKDERCA